MKSIDVFCHLMPRKYAEMVMEEAPDKSHMFMRALNIQSMSDMDYRYEVIKRFPEYKQIPNIVSPPVETVAGPDKSPRIAAIGNDEIKKIAIGYIATRWAKSVNTEEVGVAATNAKRILSNGVVA